MRMRMIGTILALATLALGTAAVAEPPIGSRVGERLTSKAIEEDRERAAGAHEVADCMASRKRKAVEQFLSATTREESSRLGKRLSGDISYCVMFRPANDTVEAQRIAYPFDILRGMLAEALIRQRLSSFAGLPPLPIEQVYDRVWYKASFRHSAVNEMATCVAETAPAGVLALLRTKAYTDAEQQALGALVPYFGPCLTAGTTLEGRSEPLRAALAESLFQRVNFPAGAIAAEAAE